MTATVIDMTDDPIRVLLVEADPEFADLAGSHLGRADDVEVVTAADGRSGLDRLGNGDVDCVVVADDLPRMDAVEFVERAADRDGAVPVLLFAKAAADDAVAEAAVDAGATYLQKGGAEALVRLENRVRHAVSDFRIATGGSAHEAVVESLKDPVYVLDAAGRFEFVNEAFLDLTGYDRAAVLGIDAALIKTPEMVARSERALTALRAADGPDDVRYEVEIRTADGRTLLCEDHVGLLPTEEGDPPGSTGVLRDVSERERRERVLAALHETTRELMIADSEAAVFDRVTEAADSVLGLGHVGIHQYEAQGADEADDGGAEEGGGMLVPVAWSEVVETTIGDPPTLGPDSLAWEAFRTGETRRYEDLRGTDGLANPETPLRSELIVPLGDRSVAIFASTDPDAFTREDERLAQVLCANATAALERVQQETALRRRERELARENERLERLTNFLSHDLRNPLEVAKGRTELAREECDSDHLNAVGRAVDRMETLVDDLLTMAREGRAVDRTEPVGLSALARDSWHNVETSGATLQVETDATVLADPDRLARLFENLFRNAVEHGSTG
ncbi:MAG: PAS domain S-box protein, partial [Haloferacaceae archaeon]